MPKLVDHDERRRAIVAAAWRLIAAHGIDGVNMRDLAAEAGYTNGALSHYFSGKDEILRTAFEHVLDATNERIAASVGTLRGREALRRLCFEIMPLTDEARLEARIAISLWQRSLADPIMEEVHDRAVADWTTRIARHWREAIDAGELPDTDIDIGTELLMTTLIGLQVTVVLTPTRAAPDLQSAMLDAIIGAPSA